VTAHKIDDDLLLLKEALHPDLRRCVRASPWEPGTFVLYHRLVIAMGLDPQRAAIENRRYELASAEVREAMRSGDWSRYVYLHERPYRFAALKRIAGKIESHMVYWNLLADVWQDSENIHQTRIGWIRLWNTDRPGKHHSMTDEERTELARLPNVLTIYRGIGDGRGRTGLSWTLDREKAIWFAGRFSGRPTLLTANANKSDVHALLLGRKEQEVVIDKFRTTSIEKVPASGINL
jgi:hypothetical protein